VAAAAARTWIASARETLRTVRAHPELGVPADVLAAFESYVEQWAEMSETADPFLWAADIDSHVLRVLGAHWARLVTIARTDPSSGLRPAPPEGEEFYNALAIAILEGAAVDDEENFSAKFEEVVPAFDPTEHEPVLASARADGQAARRRRVLLVEDTEDLRLIMRLAIEQDGRFEVAGEAANGMEAVEHCKHDCPDAVLLDLLMPEMDGYAALPLIKQHCPAANVVVFTAVASPDVSARVRALGASACLSKATPTEAVLSALAAN